MKYRILHYDDLPDHLREDCREHSHALVREEDGKTTVIFAEGGEPEDQTLHRDLLPLVKELQGLAWRLS